jgi:hypothetical protein
MGDSRWFQRAIDREIFFQEKQPRTEFSSAIALKLRKAKTTNILALLCHYRGSIRMYKDQNEDTEHGRASSTQTNR